VRLIAPALHAFKGTVSVGASSIFRAQRGCPALPETRPGFSAVFFTHGEHLVPVVRDILPFPGMHPSYGIILSPGRVWSEPGDGGLSRASFPFVITAGEASVGCRGTAAPDADPPVVGVAGLAWSAMAGGL